VPLVLKVLAAVEGLLPPDHAKVLPDVLDAVRETEVQAVAEPEKVGVLGGVLTVTDTVAVAVPQLLEAVTV
jgi:hypothetical protein